LGAAAEHAEAFGLGQHRLDLHRRQAGGDLRQLRRDELENRRPHQELLVDCRKVANHLLGQVVVELVMSSREAANKGAGLGWRPLPQSGLDEGERRRPALRPPRELSENIRLKRPAVGLPEQLLHLGIGETQLGDSDLRQLPERAQASNGDRGLTTTGEDDRQSLRSTGDDLPRDQANVGDFIRHVEIVEDQNCAVGGDRRQLGEKRLDRVLASRSAGLERAEDCRGRRRKSGIVLAAGGNEMRQEADPVSIFVVDSVPQRPEPRSTREVRQECRLAIAGVGDDEYDPAVDLDLEPVEKARPRQRLVSKRRGLDLPWLDRIAAHVVPCIDADAIGRRDQRAPGADRDRGAG
jgi:hypothetical protein